MDPISITDTLCSVGGGNNIPGDNIPDHLQGLLQICST